MTAMLIQRADGSIVEADADWQAVHAAMKAEAQAEATPDLATYAADKRWQKEVGGIVVNGVPVATDDRSKMMLMGARLAAQADPDFTTQWKTPAGFVTLDAAALVALSDAVLAHVDACFAIEAAVLADVQAEVITTVQQIDDAFG